MRISPPLFRTGPAVAAVLSFTLATGPAAAASGISVSTSGSTVSVTTSACGRINGSWGTASLLDSRQTSFAQGRQVALSGTSTAQTAAWANLGAGTYTVIVLCSDNTTAGTQAVIVSPAPSPSPTPSPTRSAAPPASAPPSRGTLGGVGGAVRDHGTATLAAGGALVGSGVIAAAWFLHRRSRPYRF
ncbi:hypothetical protein SUDANB6_05398 [Streptomyces sp. enrichment culture]|uniref:hypothetical protein n=1 Tax=Streptomyces sp. enrichment culture TaxID=1795815 RepID=UPI003F571BC8